MLACSPRFRKTSAGLPYWEIGLDKTCEMRYYQAVGCRRSEILIAEYELATVWTPYRSARASEFSGPQLRDPLSYGEAIAESLLSITVRPTISHGKRNTFPFGVPQTPSCKQLPHHKYVSHHSSVNLNYSRQCLGSVTFWCGSRSADPYLWLMDQTSFFTDFKDAKTNYFNFHTFLTRRHIIFSLKNLIFC